MPDVAQNELSVGSLSVAGTGLATETTLALVKTAVELIDNAIAGTEMQVDVVAALPAGTALIGRVGIDADTNAVGTDTFFSNTMGATATAVKATAGVLHGFEVSNPNTVDAFLQVFDLATGSVTLGTTAPKHSYLIPAGAASDKRGAADKAFLPAIRFATAITVALTTTPTGSTSPTSACTTNVQFK